MQTVVTTQLPGRPMSRAAIAVGLVLTAGLVALVAKSGQVHAVEFSPRTFRHRAIRYYQVPLLGVQVTPTQAQEWSTPLADHLRTEGYLGPTDEQADPEWSLVKGFAWGVRGWSGRAKTLCRELGCWQDERDRAWVAWSEERPDVAGELWPLVVAAVRNGDYRQASLALAAARTASSPAQFHETLRLLEGP